ncbi:MAG TPA: alpha/beta hydrolase [Candidatus Saccharimonadales bacterium]|nr:alpha/beta hydrolase [Candidatus Saccharimonadales bacterium]
MNAIIFHGTECTPDQFWYGWLAGKLRARGYTVEAPSMPDINREGIATFLPKILAAHTITEDTVLIGHSAGATLILSIGEQRPFKQGILVAGFSLPFEGVEKDPILQDSYDWKKIRGNCNDFVFINSVNDPWGCDDKQGRVMFDALGGTQIIRAEGHFGSNAAQQAYPEFPLVERLVA